MLVLNLKTYSESTGLNCKKLLDIVSEYVANTKIEKIRDRIIVAVAQTDLFWAKQNYPDLIIAAQNVDNKVQGSSTGWVPVETLLSYGVEYALYNHSEHRMYSDSILEDIKTIQSKGVKLIVCCENTQEAVKLTAANPFAIAYEPKDLIGSGISVTTRPESVSEFVKAIPTQKNILIGAGVSNGDDINKAVELGAEGVLLASAFVKALDPKAKLDELVQPFA